MFEIVNTYDLVPKKFHKSGSLTTGTKQKAKCRFWVAAMLAFYIKKKVGLKDLHYYFNLSQN
jgi:hypothetical protein